MSLISRVFDTVLPHNTDPATTRTKTLPNGESDISISRHGKRQHQGETVSQFDSSKAMEEEEMAGRPPYLHVNAYLENVLRVLLIFFLL